MFSNYCIWYKAKWGKRRYKKVILRSVWRWTPSQLSWTYVIITALLSLTLFQGKCLCQTVMYSGVDALFMSMTRDERGSQVYIGRMPSILSCSILHRLQSKFRTTNYALINPSTEYFPLYQSTLPSLLHPPRASSSLPAPFTRIHLIAYKSQHNQRHSMLFIADPWIL